VLKFQPFGQAFEQQVAKKQQNARVLANVERKLLIFVRRNVIFCSAARPYLWPSRSPPWAFPP
jgi:hypothetical protein